MDEREEYNLYTHVYFSSIASLSAIIISIIALCSISPREGRLEFDYIGVVIGILSLLVAVLIGWQIWKTIEIDKKIQAKIELEKDKFRQEVEKIIENRISKHDKDLIMWLDILYLRMDSESDVKSALSKFSAALRKSLESSSSK